MIELLFDTGVLIDIYLGRSRVRPYFNALVQGETVGYLSVLSEAELWRGLRPGEVDKHNALLQLFTSLPLRSDAARLAGQWMQEHQAMGLGWMDALITATAEQTDVGVLTRDRKLATLLGSEISFTVYG